jgi:acyl carrier protein
MVFVLLSAEQCYHCGRSSGRTTSRRETPVQALTQVVKFVGQAVRELYLEGRLTQGRTWRMDQALDAKVSGIVAEVAGRDASGLSFDTALVADLELDSLSVLQVLVELENALGVTISDRAAAGMKTIGDIAEYLRGRVRC